MEFYPLLAASIDGWCYLAIVASIILGIKYRHSFFALPLVVALSLIAEDSFYPLSYFPMYSDPDESENYFYIGTWDSDTTEPTPEEITPLPVRQLTRTTAPKTKKLVKAWIRGRADELNVKDTKLPEPEKLKQRLAILDYLREQSEGKLPAKLALIEVWIEFDEERGYRETPEIVAVQHP